MEAPSPLSNPGDITIALGDEGGHRHDWAPTGDADDLGVTPITCAGCGAAGHGLGDFSPAAHAIRSHPAGGHVHSWESAGPADGGVHPIACSCGATSTCDCPGLPAGHPSKNHPEV